MKISLKYLCLTIAVLSLLGGCTKKNTSISPDSKKEKTADKKNLDAAKPIPPAPEAPEAEVTGPSDPVTIDSPITGPAPSDNATTAASKPSFPPPSSTPPFTPRVTPETKNKEPSKPNSAGNNIENKNEVDECFTKLVQTSVSALKYAERELSGPDQLGNIKKATLKVCLKGKPIDAQTDLRLTRMIVDAAVTAFPMNELIISFFAETESKEMDQASKESILKSFGTGVELESKEIKFSGIMEKTQSSNNILSYAINSFSGDLQIKSKSESQGIKRRQINLNKEPKASVRYIFDFNSYKLIIAESGSQLELSFGFIKGDVKSLKANQNVTIALTKESWLKVVKNQFLKIANTELKNLEASQIEVSVEQKALGTSRTCQFNYAKISCVDPDAVTKAIANSPENSTAPAESLIESIQ